MVAASSRACWCPLLLPHHSPLAPVLRRFKSPRAERDFIAAGVATGIAAAFTAPLGEQPLGKQQAGGQACRLTPTVSHGRVHGLYAAGGLLFTIEEVVHFGDLSGEFRGKALLACTTALLTRNTIVSGLLALTKGSPFGWFTGDIVFEAGTGRFY